MFVCWLILFSQTLFLFLHEVLLEKGLSWAAGLFRVSVSGRERQNLAFNSVGLSINFGPKPTKETLEAQEHL